MVEKLFIKPEKGARAIERKTLNLIQDKGAHGDIFSTGGERQISILYEDTALKMKDFSGACLNKYSCNILLSGDIPENLHVGSTIKINEAKIEITQIGRRCHGICGRGSCPLIDGVIFASVIKGGEISVGEDEAYD